MSLDIVMTGSEIDNFGYASIYKIVLLKSYKEMLFCQASTISCLLNKELQKTDVSHFYKHQSTNQTQRNFQAVGN